MKPLYWLLIIIAVGLGFRILLLPAIQHPGIGDPNHYYNLAIQLVAGKGFNIDYIWQYISPPDSIFHPEDHWMPLTGVLAAGSMLLFGKSVHIALIPFILLGAVLIPSLTYVAARQFKCSQSASLFTAAFAAFLPEFMLNSLRTDTTIPNVVFVCSSIVLFTYGLEKEKWWPFAASGIFIGLAYLTRNDAVIIFPVLFIWLLLYRSNQVNQKSYRQYAQIVSLVLISAALVISPWIIRNLQVLGTPTTRELDKMLFYTNTLDHWAYEREFNLQTMMAQQTLMQVIGKRLFELAAAVKVIYTSLDVFLPVLIFGGVLWLVIGRDRDRLLRLAPTLLMIIAILIAYPILVPYKSQAGSFKKAYLTIIPLLLPVGTYALEQAVNNPRIRNGALSLALIFMGANGFELVRADAQFTNTYLGWMGEIASTVQNLPDTNNDDLIILMAQDPFMLRFVGVQSVMVPFENRAKVLEVAARYNVDYLWMPADRPSLDAIYFGEETDPQIVFVEEINDSSTKLYRFKYP